MVAEILSSSATERTAKNTRRFSSRAPSGVPGSVHDEPELGRGAAPHQVGDNPVGLDMGSVVTHTSIGSPGRSISIHSPQAGHSTS